MTHHENERDRTMSTATAICRSSAAIDPAWVKTYRWTGSSSSGREMDPRVDLPFLQEGGMVREPWVNGEREILEFKPGFGPMGPIATGRPAYAPTWKPTGPITVTQTLTGNMPQVSEKPIDWSKFLPATGCDENARPKTAHGDYPYAAGTVFASSGDSIRLMVDPRASAGRGSTTVLAGETLWDSAMCRIIRHADGTWATGYGPDGPVSAPKVEDRAALAGDVVRGLIKTMNEFNDRWRPVFKSWGGDKKPASAELAVENSIVADLPDAPRADSHRSLEHMKPRWKTPAYEAPGRWRR